MERSPGSWNKNILDYLLEKNRIKSRDGAEVTWCHAVNSKSKLNEAIQSEAHMIEADVLLRESKGPIMAHPPETDSDITLQEWLNDVSSCEKGIKLDFKCCKVNTQKSLTNTFPDESKEDQSTEAVLPSLQILAAMKATVKQPVWINADILPGPGGKAKAVDAKEFIRTVMLYFPDVTLSLGWTTGWNPGQDNEGYSWEMVQEMEKICKGLSQPVTFPVRAALLRQSWPQFQWLLKTADRFSLTVWAGKDDTYPVEDLLLIRDNAEKCRIYYDLFEPQNSQFKRTIE